MEPLDPDYLRLLVDFARLVLELWREWRNRGWSSAGASILNPAIHSIPGRDPRDRWPRRLMPSRRLTRRPGAPGPRARAAPGSRADAGA
jgi:hypothetical protein